jgi:hypothetical protein
VHPPTRTFIYTTNEEEGTRFSFESDLSGEIPETCQSFVKVFFFFFYFFYFFCCKFILREKLLFNE